MDGIQDDTRHHFVICMIVLRKGRLIRLSTCLRASVPAPLHCSWPEDSEGGDGIEWNGLDWNGLDIEIETQATRQMTADQTNEKKRRWLRKENKAKVSTVGFSAPTCLRVTSPRLHAMRLFSPTRLPHPLINTNTIP